MRSIGAIAAVLCPVLFAWGCADSSERGGQIDSDDGGASALIENTETTGSPGENKGRDSGDPQGNRMENDSGGFINTKPDSISADANPDDAVVDAGATINRGTNTGDGEEPRDHGDAAATDRGDRPPIDDERESPCCPNGDCLCHGPTPAELTADNGPFQTDSHTISLTATGDSVNSSLSRIDLYYPVDAEPPFAVLVMEAGITSTGSPLGTGWGPFFASWGIVIADARCSALLPDRCATRLLEIIENIRKENTNSSSPLFGKISDRSGVVGYSMGGGGITIASSNDQTLKAAVGLAAWNPITEGVQVPTLLLCGDSDIVVTCDQTRVAYDALPDTTSKMMMSISGATHMYWFHPATAGDGASGGVTLAFLKVFLEGDERWKPLLLQPPDSATEFRTNIE